MSYRKRDGMTNEELYAEMNRALAEKYAQSCGARQGADATVGVTYPSGRAVVFYSTGGRTTTVERRLGGDVVSLTAERDMLVEKENVCKVIPLERRVASGSG